MDDGCPPRKTETKIFEQVVKSHSSINGEHDDDVTVILLGAADDESQYCTPELLKTTAIIGGSPA